MILYAIHYKCIESGYEEWTMVSIHKSFEVATKFMNQYMNNHTNNSSYNAEFNIYEIDTDIDSDIVYDYEIANNTLDNYD